MTPRLVLLSLAVTGATGCLSKQPVVRDEIRVHILGEQRSVPYRTLSDTAKRDVDAAIDALVARGRGSTAMSCTTQSVSGSWNWRAICREGNCVVAIYHTSDGHSTEASCG